MNHLVEQAGFTVATGFLGTPVILDALTDAGYTEAAYSMVLNHSYPSWLYSVDMGATTIWERWDSMLPDGSINPGEMTSFNHYAFGAVADWMHRTIGGLTSIEPGYRRVRIAPVPTERITSAEVSHLSPYGLIAVSWRVADDFEMTVIVPVGVTAEVVLPAAAGRRSVTVGHGTHVFTSEWHAPAESAVKSTTILR
jgi:alpha-L-rhamnosidase